MSNAYIMESQIVSGTDEATVGSRHQSHWSGRCWRLSFRILSAAVAAAAAAAAVICLTECSHGHVHDHLIKGSLTPNRNWGRLYVLLSNRERHDLMGLSSGCLVPLHRIDRYKMRATSFISNPAFSVVPSFTTAHSHCRRVVSVAQSFRHVTKDGL